MKSTIETRNIEDERVDLIAWPNIAASDDKPLFASASAEQHDGGESSPKLKAKWHPEGCRCSSLTFREEMSAGTATDALAVNEVESKLYTPRRCLGERLQLCRKNGERNDAAMFTTRRFFRTRDLSD